MIEIIIGNGKIQLYVDCKVGDSFLLKIDQNQWKFIENWCYFLCCRGKCGSIPAMVSYFLNFVYPTAKLQNCKRGSIPAMVSYFPAIVLL